MTDRRYLTTDEAADYSRLSVHTVRDAAALGELAGIKTSPRGRWLFTTTDVDAWLEAKRRDLRTRITGAHPTTEVRRRLHRTA